MSKYTTQVLQLIYGLTPEMPISPLSERLEKARQQIFNFQYPIWNEEHKKDLETKILRHYINWEIGMETYPLWQFYLETRMNEIMPYYVELYESIYPFKDKLYYNQDVEEKYEESTTDGFTDTYDGTVQNTGDTDYTRQNDVDGTSNDLTTNNLTDNTTNDKSVTEEKNVKGDVVSENTRTDNLNETVANSATNSNTRTDNLTEITTLDKDVTENSSTTVNGRDLQIVSDLPQTNLGGLQLSVENPAIYKLDYASQSTQNASNTTTIANRTLQEDDTTNKTNSGTVKNDGSEKSDTTKQNTGNQTNNGSEETTEDTSLTHAEKDTNVSSHTGTVNTDNTISSTQNIVDHTKDVNLRTDKNQRVMDRGGSKNFTDTRRGLNSGKTYAEVIAEYLPQIRNIDMLIIKDLNSLFMNIF